MVMVIVTVCGALAYNLSQEVCYEVPGAHLDDQWQWDLAATIGTYLPNTMSTNFAYFAQYPEYVFNFEGAFRYWLIKKVYPTSYATLKTHIANGRWRVAGGGADPGDVNLPSAEGLIRNYLYGNNFFMDEFGKRSMDVYLPDCFGFGYQLPTIAAHMGLIGFSTQKFDLWGGWFATPFPIGRWIGVDGNSVIATLKPGDYGNGMDIQTADGDWLKSHSGTPGIWATYDYIGTGDVGGGPSAGDVSAMITRIRANASNTIKVYATSTDQVYRDLDSAGLTSSLPSYNGELLMTTHGTGCYTAWAKMKYKNRKNEQRAMLTEFADVTANWMTGATFAYPQDTIWHAWWRVIACQFHDGITGTSIPNAYSQYWLPMEDSSYNDFTYAMNLGNNVMANSAGQQLTTTVSTAGDVSLVLVNALARARCDVVEATVNFGTAAPTGVKVYNPDGVEVPSQILSAAGQNVTIAFVARMPSASYAVYEVKPMTVANAADPNLTVTAAATGSTLSNAFYTVTVNANGDISGVLDKKTNKQLLSAPSRFELRTDQGTSFPAWELRWEDVSSTPTGYVDQAVAMTMQENGPARVSLKVVRTKNGSTFTQYISLAADSAGNRVEVKNAVNWVTAGTLLKVGFPVSCTNDSTTWDIGIGTIKRGVMFYNASTSKGLYEVCGQQWADQTATDNSYGISVLNDCKYGWNKESTGKFNLTLIHSPAGGGYNYQGDQSSVAVVGVHNFVYAIYGHQGSWTNGTVDQAERLNQPIFSFQPTTPAVGKIGRTISLVRTSTDQVAVMAIKKAEKSANYIIRVRETQGASVTNAKLTFPSATIIAASEVNGQEEAKGAATFSGSDLTFNMTKYQPKTFAVSLGVPVAVNQKFEDLLRPKATEMTVTVSMASGCNVHVSLRVPADAKILGVSIVDVAGRLVQKLAPRSGGASQAFVWDGRDLYSHSVGKGVYFVNVATDRGHSSARLPVVQ